MTNINTGVLLLAACLAACTHPHAAEPPPSNASAAAAAPAASNESLSSELRDHHRHHHQGGLTQFVAMSLDTMGADDVDRPQIEQLQDALRTCLAPSRAVEKTLLQTLGDGVASGNIDQTKADMNVGQLAFAATNAHPCSVDTLNKLHAILSPAERQALVDKVNAHWQVWRQVNSEEKVDGKSRGNRLADLATELNLTQDQADKMVAALHSSMATLSFDPAQAQAQLQAFSAAFTAGNFDAKNISLNANGLLATWGARKMVLFYETVTPLLTPEQRTTLGAHLHEHVGQSVLSSK